MNTIHLYMLLSLATTICSFAQLDDNSLPKFLLRRNSITEMPPKERIVGEWGIYVYYGKQSSTLCNSCPRINFKTDGTATIYQGTEVLESYDWQCVGDSLFFHCNDDAHTIFRESVYITKFTMKAAFEKLILEDCTNPSYLTRFISNPGFEELQLENSMSGKGVILRR